VGYICSTDGVNYIHALIHTHFLAKSQAKLALFRSRWSSEVNIKTDVRWVDF